MTKRETYCTVRGLKVWATAGLMLILVLCSGPALAAQIDITNCTSTKVAICTYDNKKDDVSITRQVLEVAGGSLPNKGKFTCKSDCYFWMTTTDFGNAICDKSKYHKIDHSWGSGDYLLVGLAMTSKQQYKSGDLQKGTTCP